MSPWGWEPKRTEGIWRYGAGWIRPFVAALPVLTILLLVLLLSIVSETLTISNGVTVELPDSGIGDGEKTDWVALVLQMPRETLVFFDDSRYVLDDGASSRALADHLTECVARSENRTLLVLADRRVSSGNLFGLAALARRSGVKRLLFAEKRTEEVE